MSLDALLLHEFNIFKQTHPHTHKTKLESIPRPEIKQWVFIQMLKQNVHLILDSK